jgi:hypothetical protein
MMRTLILILLATSALLGQTSEKVDLLKRTEELEGFIAAGEWGKASELSRSLRDAVTEGRDRSLAASGSDLADSILRWLPTNTETLVVAQEPFTINKEDKTKVATALQEAQGHVLGNLAEAEKGKLWEVVLGRTVRLAALGARRFGEHSSDASDANNVAQLGMIDYEGCAVYAFAAPLPESILSRPPDDSVMGYRVWISKGTQNDGPATNTYLVSLLQPDLMTVCNNREFFREMASRRDLPQQSRALPADLPEWKQLDRTAPLWAICHYRSDGLLVHMFDNQDDGRERGATGIAVEFGVSSGMTRARMISKSDPWKDLTGSDDFHGAAKSRKVADGVWELSVSGNPEAAGMAAFVLMGMVGFVVLL